MDTRLGYPSEHLSGNNSIEISSPMYATAVGLVMNSSKSKKKIKNKSSKDDEENDISKTDEESQNIGSVTIFERFTQSLKTFLDNAE